MVSNEGVGDAVRDGLRGANHSNSLAIARICNDADRPKPRYAEMTDRRRRMAAERVVLPTLEEVTGHQPPEQDENQDTEKGET